MTVNRNLRSFRRYCGGWTLAGALCSLGAVSVILLPEVVLGQPTPTAAAPNNANPSVALTAKPVRLVSVGRPLIELQKIIESSLGMRIVLTGSAGEAMLNGEVTGQDGLAFFKELANRLRMDWAVGKTELYLGSEGSARATTFVAPSAEVANKVATLANKEFESQGSNIRVVAKKDDLTVTGLPGWVNQVAAIRVPALIEQAKSDISKSVRRSQGLSEEDADDPMSVMVFQLNNAFVDDKRLSVGSSVVVIPGVARLFRQFTGMAGGSSDSTSTSTGPEPGIARVARVEPIAGGRSSNREGDRQSYDRADASDRGNTFQRSERSDASSDMSNAALNADLIANRPAVIGDSRMNALVIRDRTSRLEMHRALIKVLDQAANMVQLDAYVIDIKANRLSEFGLGLSWGGNSLNPGGAAPGSSNVILQATSGSLLLSRIRALESTGESEILSVPSVVTLNNLEATFSSRENFYVRVSGNQDAALSKVTAETLLKVTPLVTHQNTNSASDKRIRLLVSIQDGSVDATNGALVDSIPRTLENQISTQAVVRGGDTLVIGGQVVRKKVNAVSGLPFIKDIPILGNLTNTKSVQYETFVRVYVVRPTLLGEDSSYASTATNNNRVLDRIPEMIRGTSLAPESSTGSMSSTGEEITPRIIPLPQGKASQNEQADKPTQAPTAPVSQAPAKDIPKATMALSAPRAANATSTPSVFNNTGFEIAPQKQTTRDRSALQILNNELSNAEQSMRKYERDAANGSAQAKESMRRVQSDIESIQYEIQRLSGSARANVVSSPVR